MNKSTIIKLIEDSGFSEKNQKALFGCLNLLGNYSLFGLSRKLSEYDRKLTESYTTNLWVNFSVYFSGFINSDNNAQGLFWKKLSGMSAVLNDEDKVDFLWCVLDVKNFLVSKNLINNRQELVEFEIQCFEYLPEKELLFLLNKNIIRLCVSLNLYNGLQFLFDKNYWSLKYGNMIEYSKAIMQNSELVLSKSVSQWITDFLNFTNVPIKQRGSIHITEFLTKNNLTKESQGNCLSEIFRIYLWILNPIINEENVKEFIDQRKIYKQQFAEEQILLAQKQFILENNGKKTNFDIKPQDQSGIMFGGGQSKASPPTPPYPKGDRKSLISNPSSLTNKPQAPTPPLKGIMNQAKQVSSVVSGLPSQINIDKKLEELKKRSG